MIVNSQSAHDTSSDDSLRTTNNNIDDGHNPNDLPVLPTNDHGIAGSTQVYGAVEQEGPYDSEAPDVCCMVEIACLS